MPRLTLIPSVLLLLTLSSLSAQDPDAVERYRAGYQLLQGRSFRNAAIELQEAVAIDSTYGAAHLALGMAYKVLNEHQRAIAAYENARKLGTFPERAADELARLYYRAGVELFSQRRYQDAVESFQGAVELDPGNARALYAMGLCYNGLRDAEQAEWAFRAAIAVDPDYPQPLRALGDLHRRRREYNTAMEAYREAIAIDSTHMEAYSGLVRIMLENEAYQEAVRLMQSAVEIDAGYADGYLYLGSALFRLGRFSDAVPPLRQAVNLAPDDAESHFRLAEALYGKGDYRAAYEACRLAIRNRRNFHAAEVLMGDISVRLGRSEEARSWYTRAMQDSRFRDYSRHQLERLNDRAGR